jgi:hypothetical protein
LPCSTTTTDRISNCSIFQVGIFLGENPMQFPRWYYHPTAPFGRIISTADELAALGAGWVTTPADFPAGDDAPPPIEPYPEPARPLAADDAPELEAAFKEKRAPAPEPEPPEPEPEPEPPPPPKRSHAKKATAKKSAAAKKGAKTH